MAPSIQTGDVIVVGFAGEQLLVEVTGLETVVRGFVLSGTQLTGDHDDQRFLNFHWQRASGAFANGGTFSLAGSQIVGRKEDGIYVFNDEYAVHPYRPYRQ